MPPDNNPLMLNENTANDALIRRLRARWRIVVRKVFLYALAIAMLALAKPLWPTFVAGCVLIAAGLMVRIWAFGHLQKNQALITSGPYAHTRNPAYLGSALAGIGFFLAAGNFGTAVGIAIWIAGVVGLGLFFFQYLPRKYRIEYTRLESEFGDQARLYADSVPDFWPRLTPWNGRSRQSFSWSRVSANHEWGWAPLCALALALMWF